MSLAEQTFHDRVYYDLERQRWIESLGVRVLRVGNDDVLHDMDAVLEAILVACGVPLNRSLPSPQRSPGGRGS